MKINYLKFKSMFAYAPEMQTINFTDPTTLYTLIIGKNGRGKSSITKILNIALYFSCEGIPMGEFANEINGDGYVEVSIDSRGHSWTIISEYSTTKLKSLQVYQDGVLQDWGGIKTTKEKVAQTIIDIPQKLFNNIINLSVNDFKSFLSLSAKDSRDIRDKIFSFGVLNQMVQAESARFSQNKKEIDRIQATIDSIKAHLNSQYEDYKNAEQYYATTITQAQQEASDYQSNITTQVAELEHRKTQVESELQANRDTEARQTTLRLINSTLATQQEVTALQEQVVSLNEQKTQVEQELQTEQSKLESLNSCAIVRTRSTILSKIDVVTTHLNELNATKDALESELQSLESERSTIQALQEVKQVKINSTTTTLQEVESHLQHLRHLSPTRTTLLKIQSKFPTKDKLTSYYDEMVSRGNAIQAEYQRLTESLALLNAERTTILTRLDLIETGTDSCPTCGSPIDSSSIVTELQNRIQEIEGITAQSTTEIAQAQSLLSENKSTIDKVQEIKTKVEMLEQAYTTNPLPGKTLQEFLSYDLDQDLSSTTDRVTTLRNELETLKSDLTTGDSVTPKITTKTKELQAIITKKAQAEAELQRLESTLPAVITLPPDLEHYTTMLEVEFTTTMEAVRSSIATLENTLLSINNSILTTTTTIASKQESINSSVALLSQTIPDFTLPESPIPVDSSIQSKITTLTATLQSITKEINALQVTQVELNNKVTTLEVERKTKMEYLESTIEKTKAEIERYTQETAVILHENNIQEAFIKTLSDDGIKSYVMGKIVPYLNQEINSFISRFNINVTVEFDAEFVGTLRRNGHSPSLQSISTGQRKIIDVCILLAITKFFIKKYPDVNLVFYDEIFSSLDTENSPTILKLIKQEFCETLGITVCLVSHQFVNPTLIDRFISVEDKNYFSTLSILSKAEYMQTYQ